jgi:hypothetical protein
MTPLRVCCVINNRGAVKSLYHLPASIHIVQQHLHISVSSFYDGALDDIVGCCESLKLHSGFTGD